jgi:6-pyruvoyltetrahydropterin/6-carboxytetrahydropterin synthase
MRTCTRRLTFCAGHRVMGHENKCRNLHGHNYVVKVEAEADSLDKLGRVVDFGVIKATIGSWIEDSWDHGFLVFRDDLEVINALRLVPGQKVFLAEWNPTAENIAGHLLHVAGELLAPFGVAVRSVVVWETENCAAEATA